MAVRRTKPGAARARSPLRAAAAGLDVLVLLLGTFGVWLVLGFAEFDQDIADWLPPAVVATGALVAAATTWVAAAAWRGRPATRVALGVAASHVALALCTVGLLHAPVEAAVLLAGALVVAWAGTSPPSRTTPEPPEPAVDRGLGRA